MLHGPFQVSHEGRADLSKYKRGQNVSREGVTKHKHSV